MYLHFLHHIKKSYSKGFTLIELVVTIAVAGVLSVVIASIMTVGIDSYNLFNAHATMSRESQDAVRVMADKIGMAIPSTISQKTNRQFRFTATNGENVRFQFRNGTKEFRYRIAGSSWRELMHNMTNFSFFYLIDLPTQGYISSIRIHDHVTTIILVIYDQALTTYVFR